MNYCTIIPYLNLIVLKFLLSIAKNCDISLDSKINLIIAFTDASIVNDISENLNLHVNRLIGIKGVVKNNYIISRIVKSIKYKCKNCKKIRIFELKANISIDKINCITSECIKK